MDFGFFTEASPVQSDRILYTPSDFARTSLLYMQETGILHAQKAHTSKRTHLQSFLCFVVLEGCGELEYNKNQYQLKKGDCVFIDCRKPYAHRTNKHLWALQWIHFYGFQMPSIYDKYLSRGGQAVFTPLHVSKFTEVMSALYDFGNSDDYIRDMRINEQLNKLLTLLMEQSWNPKNIPASSKKLELDEIQDYINEHYTEKISLDGLAQHFYINKYYLMKLFKERYGITINHYILAKRITTAKQMLRFTDKTMEEIANLLGFADANYFCRMFKKIEGMTPGKYRKSW